MEGRALLRPSQLGRLAIPTALFFIAALVFLNERLYRRSVSMFGARAFWQRLRIAGYALGVLAAIPALLLQGTPATIAAGAYFAIVLLGYSIASIRFLRKTKTDGNPRPPR